MFYRIDFNDGIIDYKEFRPGKFNYLNHYIFYFYFEGNSIIYSFPYSEKDKEHKAKLNLYEWATHLHGNPPAGMDYGYYRIKTPTGQTFRLKASI